MEIAEINQFDDKYPINLHEADDRPASIFTIGDIPSGPILAIVGTRKCTAYGNEITYQMASELARAGLVIASGLAYGTDSIAHLGALDAGGKTIAIMAGGLDRLYPAAHRGLALRILATGGALISEWPAGERPRKQRFVARNRIVSGLSIGVLIVESGPKGGSLFTAKFARDQNRIVMAVPGRITDETSAGTNNLIRTGAIPVTSSSDVLQALEMPTGLIPASVIKAQNPHEQLILEILESGKSTSERLIERTGLTAPEFASVISLMEITGKVRNLGAGHWAHR